MLYSQRQVITVILREVSKNCKEGGSFASFQVRLMQIINCLLLQMWWEPNISISVTCPGQHVCSWVPRKHTASMLL